MIIPKNSILAMIRILVCIALAISLAVPVEAARKEEPAQDKSISKIDIQQGVMSLSDTWMAATHQALKLMLEEIEDPEQRLRLKQQQYFGMSAVLDLATSPNPGISLLDMMVLTTLSRSIWESHWMAIYGEPASHMQKAMSLVETNTWDFAATILTSRQVKAMRELVDEWLIEHPNATGASYVRLSDFGELDRKPSIDEALKKGGFLSPIRDAAHSADEIKELAERALYMSLRMQELMFTRLEITTQSLLLDPGISSLIDDVHGLRNSAERYADVLESMPDDIRDVVDFTLDEVSTERQATINQLLEGLATERSNALDQMLAGVAAERQKTLEQTLAGLQRERVGLLKAVAHTVYWFELEMEALMLRLFIISVSLITLWFALRLTYRYWVDRAANNFIKTLGVLAILLLVTLPFIILGSYLVNLVEPDLSDQAEFMTRLEQLIEQEQQ